MDEAAFEQMTARFRLGADAAVPAQPQPIPAQSADEPKHPLMQCGHAASGPDSSGRPVCVICVGIKPGAEIVDSESSVEGRTARCPDCKRTQPSSTKLAFFESRPDREFDSYYCGCRGWN